MTPTVTIAGVQMVPMAPMKPRAPPRDGSAGKGNLKAKKKLRRPQLSSSYGVTFVDPVATADGERADCAAEDEDAARQVHSLVYRDSSTSLPGATELRSSYV
jgi:hypothetical protein